MTSNPINRICHICGQTFPYEKLRKNKNRPDGVESTCLTCDYKRTKLRGPKQVDPEKRKANDKKRNQGPKRQQWKRTYVKQYYRDNREKHLAYMKDYRKQHPEVDQKHTQKRRAIKRGIPHTLTFDDWQHCLDYFGGCCAVCGRPPGLFHTIAQDHWIPLTSQNCPGTIPANIIPLCHSQKGDQGGCNNSKSARDPIEWLNGKFGKRRAKKIIDRIKAYFDSIR